MEDFSDLQEYFIEEEKKEFQEIGVLAVDRVVLKEGEEVKEELKCRICMGILRSPQECKTCENCFCQECLDKWLQNSNQCPLKCSQFPKFRDRPHKVIRNMLSDLKLYCKNKENGCSEILSYDSLPRHENSICQFERFECSGAANGCTAILSRADLVAHEAACEFVSVICDYCQQPVRRGGIQDHWKHCEDVELSCELCNGLFKKKNYFIHVNVQCEEYLMNCGRCQCSYKRKYKEFHDCVRYLHNCLKTQGEEIAKLKKEALDKDRYIQNMELNFKHELQKIKDQLNKR